LTSIGRNKARSSHRGSPRTKFRVRDVATSLLLVALMAAPAAAGQAETQIWGDVTLNWIKSRQLTFGADFEPKALVSKPADVPGWATLDVTPSVEYSRGNWFDVVGELLVARTKQTDDLNSTEVTPRLGLRFHILSNLKNDLLKEKLPKRRLVVRDFLRFEWRNLYYSTGEPEQSSFRLRDRVELQYPVNRPRLTDDGAIYLLGDAEWFWTGQDVEERYASKQRVRGGIGHRRSQAWRVEAIYVWDRSRHAATDGFTVADSAVELRVRRVW